MGYGLLTRPRCVSITEIAATEVAAVAYVYEEEGSMLNYGERSMAIAY